MRILLRFFMWLMATLLLCFGVVALYIYVNADEIKQQALARLNQYLKVPAQVQSIDITWWAQFPEVSLKLSGLTVSSMPANPAGKPLMAFEEAGMGFSLKDIYNKQYRIKSIYLKKGSIYAYTNAEGQANYDIISNDTSAASDSQNSHLNLKQVLLIQSDITWHQADLKVNATADRLNFSGDFSQKRFKFKTDLKGTLNEFSKGEFIRKKSEVLEISTDMDADKDKQLYTVSSGKLLCGELLLKIAGSLRYDRVWHSDVSLSQSACQMGVLLGWLPEKVQSSLKTYKPSGNISIDIKAIGPFIRDYFPDISFNCNLSNGAFIDEVHHRKIHHIGLKASGAILAGGAESQLYIQGLSAQSGSLKCSGDIKYIAKNWHGKLLLNGMLKDLNPFLSKQTQFKKGRFDADVELSGTTEDFRNGHTEALDIHKFVMRLEQAALKFRDDQFEQISVDASTNGKDLHLGDLHFQMNAQPVEVQADVDDFMPWLFGKGQPRVKARVHFDHLKLNEYKSTDTTSKNMAIQDFDLKLDGKEFIYGRHQLLNPELHITMQEGNVEVHRGQFGIYGGLVEIKQLGYHRGNRLLMLKADIQDINIKDMFTGLENFGQEVLTDQHLSGKFSAKSVEASVPLDAQGKPLYKQLVLETDMLIQEGRLVNFEPIYALSKFIQIEELKDIRFAELKNRISVHDNQIFIPDMQIRNSVLNIQMSGTHSFDNVLDYHLKMLLKEVLLKKRKERTSDEFGSFEPAADKGMNIYIFIKGPMGKLKIGYDRKQAREGTKEKMKEERKQLREIFNREGKVFKKDKKLNPAAKDSLPADEGIKWDEDQ